MLVLFPSLAPGLAFHLPTTSSNSADVQWAPHHTLPHSIVSTSAQKLLLWNLALPSESAITREVDAHTRAIADINWGVFNPKVRLRRDGNSRTEFVLTWFSADYRHGRNRRLDKALGHTNSDEQGCRPVQRLGLGK